MKVSAENNGFRVYAHLLTCVSLQCCMCMLVVCAWKRVPVRHVHPLTCISSPPPSSSAPGRMRSHTRGAAGRMKCDRIGEKKTGGQADRLTDRPRQTDRQAGRQTQTSRQTVRQADREAHRQTGRHADRQARRGCRLEAQVGTMMARQFCHEPVCSWLHPLPCL